MGVISDLIKAGVDPDLIEKVHGEIIEASHSPASTVKTARQERNQRYYENRKNRLNGRLKASESVLNKELSQIKTIKTEIQTGSRACAESESNLLSLLESKEERKTLVQTSPKPKDKSPEKELILDVVAGWNDGLAECWRLPKVRDITTARQSAILARGRDFLEIYEFADVRAGFAELFSRIEGSIFLRGEANGFKCDFDFAVTKQSFTKIMEGKYEGSRQEKYSDNASRTNGGGRAAQAVPYRRRYD